MDATFLIRILNATSLSTEEINEYVNQYVQTMYTVMLESMLKFMSEHGHEEELAQLRESFEALENEDKSLEDIIDGDETHYGKWGEIISNFLKEYGTQELLGNIDKALKELDNSVIDEILNGLSPEDKKKVLERLDILYPQLNNNTDNNDKSIS